MAQAIRDDNRITVLQGALNTDGSTPTSVKVNVSNSNSLMADDDTTGSDNGPTNATRDDNRIPIAMVVSEVDGTTPVALYVNSSGELLIDST